MLFRKTQAKNIKTPATFEKTPVFFFTKTQAFENFRAKLLIYQQSLPLKMDIKPSIR